MISGGRFMHQKSKRQLERERQMKRLVTGIVVVSILLVAVITGMVISLVKNKKTNKPAEESGKKEIVSTEDSAQDPATPPDAGAAEDATPFDASMTDAVKKYTIHTWHETGDTVVLPSADFSLSGAASRTDSIESAGEDTGESDGNDLSAASMSLYEPLALSPAAGSWNDTHNPAVTGENPTKTSQITSTNMVLVDLDTDGVVAERSGDMVVSPASMTKILTVLTASNYISEKDLEDTFTITPEIVAYSRENQCSAVGFRAGQKVTVRDLVYGTVLCSGGDAAMGLAEYTAGSVDRFVELMNQECELLGISGTAHFTNPVGIYDPDLHCTVKDMAVILSTAVQNELCRDAFSARTYMEPPDEDHPDGNEISNWFLRKIEDKETGGNVVCAKTGFVNESGCCAASYLESASGKRYVCVTVNTYSSWRCIYDHVSIYRSYVQ